MIVVSNTSPITNLAAIGQLDLLRQMYQQVIIPEAVFEEAESGRHPGAVVQQTRSSASTNLQDAYYAYNAYYSPFSQSTTPFLGQRLRAAVAFRGTRRRILPY